MHKGLAAASTALVLILLLIGALYVGLRQPAPFDETGSFAVIASAAARDVKPHFINADGCNLPGCQHHAPTTIAFASEGLTSDGGVERVRPLWSLTSNAKRHSLEVDPPVPRSTI